MNIDLALIGELIDRYVLPLAMFGGFLFLIYKRIFVLGSELERTVVAFREDAAYREERRKEERDGRLAAEAALREMSGALSDLTDAIEAGRAEGPEREDRRGTRR